MTKTFVTRYDDIVVTQLVGKNLVNANFTRTSINLIKNDAYQGNHDFEKNMLFREDVFMGREDESIRDYGIPISILTSNSLPADEVKDHAGSINEDKCINLWCQDGWKGFDVDTVENGDTVRSLLPVIVTALTIDTIDTNSTRNTAWVNVKLVDE